MLHPARRAATLLLLLFATVPLAAQQPTPARPDPTRIALARQLLNLVQPPDSGISAMMKSFIPEQGLGAMMPPGLLDSIQAVTLRVAPMVLDSTAALYAARFTSEELRGLVDFFGSALGRKFSVESVAIGAEMMGLHQRLVMPLWMEQFDRMMSGIRPPGD